MEKPKYKRVLLKISGEALAGEASRGLDFHVIGQVCDVVKKCVELGVQVGIVVGGGNFWRGVKDGGDQMVRVRADHMGMLATTINALALGTGKTKITFIFQAIATGIYLIYLYGLNNSTNTTLTLYLTAEYLFVILLALQSIVYLKRNTIKKQIK